MDPQREGKCPYRTILCAVIETAITDLARGPGKKKTGSQLEHFHSAKRFIHGDGLKYYCDILDLDRDYFLSKLAGMTDRKGVVSWAKRSSR